MRRLSPALIGLSLAACPGQPRFSELAPGDLVFLDLDCGELCDAMERVTAQQLGVVGPALSHVALVTEGGPRARAIEAWPEGGVVERPLEQILARVRHDEGQRGPLIGRLRPERRALGERAARAARQLAGRPYDHRFLPDEQRLYCAELVLRAFRIAAAPEPPPFGWLPMRFGRPGTRERATWDRYYRRLGVPVPEGERGVSPLGIYRQGQPLFREPEGR